MVSAYNVLIPVPYTTKKSSAYSAPAWSHYIEAPTDKDLL